MTSRHHDEGQDLKLVEPIPTDYRAVTEESRAETEPFEILQGLACSRRRR